MIKILILSACIYVVSEAALAQMNVKAGGEMKIEGKEKIWIRTLSGGTEETITSCEEKKENCNKFINNKTKKVNEETKAEVTKDGTLIVKNFQKADEGSYTQPEASKPRITQNKDGTSSAVAGLTIHVSLE
ncbi:hypothetical protein WR25_16259 [Diploscapter pachys]|uniref:Uncharacterized protein n=1 Tax=Diploscapter pachys TaxID=2018661 RepID=A0A2A2L850_9BILA|nr:hypothetical protein WR25_16259 [Diploscapter pachys]